MSIINVHNKYVHNNRDIGSLFFKVNFHDHVHYLKIISCRLACAVLNEKASHRASLMSFSNIQILQHILQLFPLSVKCSVVSWSFNHNPSLQPPRIIVCLDQSWDKACILIQLIIILTRFSVRWKRAITPPFSSENWALFREIKILQLAPRGLTAQGFRASQVPNYQRTDLRMALTFTSCTLRTCPFGNRHHMEVSA